MNIYVCICASVCACVCICICICIRVSQAIQVNFKIVILQCSPPRMFHYDSMILNTKFQLIWALSRGPQDH